MIMPVPIAVTHPKGKGIAAANPAELQTEGPFARLAAKRTAEPHGEQQLINGNGQHAKISIDGRDSIGQDVCSCSVRVSHLDFSYPGLGKNCASVAAEECSANCGPSSLSQSSQCRSGGSGGKQDGYSWYVQFWPQGYVKVQHLGSSAACCHCAVTGMQAQSQ